MIKYAETMYKRFYHSKRRYVLWAILVLLAQLALFYTYPDLVTTLERMIWGLENPLPVFVPLYFVIIYAIISRHVIMSTLTGLLSWWSAPMVLIILGKVHPSMNVIPETVIDGFIYAFIGLLTAYISKLIVRRKVART